MSAGGASPAGAEAVQVYVGIGSNLDDPHAQVRRAIAALSELAEADSFVVSSLYRSAPLISSDAPADQPDYINAVAGLRTRLAPLDLLARLQAVEQAQGRVRDGVRWGPRTLDLDILLYGDEIIAQETLRVPHPGLGERAFVLYPLLEIAPGLCLPDGRRLEALVAACAAAGLEKLEGK